MADDPELEAIRRRRMQQLMEQHGVPGNTAMSQEEAEQQENAKRAQEEQRRAMLVAVLDASARERLSRIALVKPEKARRVENIVLQMAQRGQLAEKITEDRLISLLEQFNEKTDSKTRVTIQRRRPNLLDDDDDW